jgi:hypothetical protein
MRWEQNQSITTPFPFKFPTSTFKVCVLFSHQQLQIHTRMRPRLDSTLCGPKGREDQRTVRDKYSLRFASDANIVKREPAIKSEKNQMCKHSSVNHRGRPVVTDVSAQANDFHEDFCHNCNRRCGVPCEACSAQNMIVS